MKNIRKQGVNGIYSFLEMKIWFILLAIMCMLTFSCDSFTEVELPDSQLTGNAVFEDPATVNAAFANIYAKLRDDVLITGSSSGLNVLMGLYADELDYYGVPGENVEQFYRHTVLPSNAEVTSIWNDTYNLVYAANSILEGVQGSTSLTESEKREFLGEALFIRAYLHFYLLNLFGPIPFIDSTDYAVNSKVSRMPENEVIDLMVQDLLMGQNYLSESIIDSERIEPSTLAIAALLSRIYLYSGNYSLAEQFASQVINDNRLMLGETTESVFERTSPSTIWQLKPATGKNTWEAFTFIFVNAPPPYIALSPSLVDSFEADDTRRTQWIGTVTNGNNTYYYPYKYKKLTGANNEYSILFRLAEQFLIRSEARVYMGDYEGAKQDLNRVRGRAGLLPITANSESELLLAIENERTHELFTEQGHRWFDLKRTDRANAVLGPIKPAWKSTDLLLPLPEAELILNPNLQPQNPGY